MKLEEYLAMRANLVFFGDEDQKGSVKYNIKWYSKRHPWYRVAYRVSGLLLLIMAFVLPLWVTSGESGLALLSGFGTFVVSLSTFYSFKQAWSGYYLAQYNLEVLMDLYEEKIQRATLMAADGEAKAVELAVNATEDVMKSSAEVINAETKGYFASIKLPSFLSGIKSK